ncbi:hypothetical protein CSOJ01_11021 [Colletotrichum sojae]|uniref:Uncharacterized protein n=1 Tax=Colletotrichum sojae TaxID=2175907 RepID=A0A8H6MP93_9PEZI|nr:hypothetical protein CSOJ01_11021 [Colletotrichum sojae]
MERLWQPDTEVFPSLNDTMDKGNVFRNTAPYIYETGRKFRFDAVAESSGDTEFIRSMHFWTMRSLNQMGHYEALLCHVKVHLAATRLCIEDLAQVSMKRLQMCLYYVPITERVAADIFRLFVDLDQYEQQGEDTDDVKYELLRYMIAHHDVLSDLAAYRFCLDHYPNVARDLVLLINELIREGTPEEEEDFWTED